MHPNTPQGRAPQPGTVSRSVVIDLERLTPADQRVAAERVGYQAPGSGARIYVGEFLPYLQGAHPDVVRFLADAVIAGVHVRFEGTDDATTDWARAISALTTRAAPPPPPRRRHLRMVGS
jgi:hypothetical protein